MIENNGWPGKHGVPPKQEYRGWHWLYLYNGAPSPAYWDGHWIMNGSCIQAEDLNPQINYWGECLTPAELDARVQEARRDALEEAMSRVKAYSQNETARNILTIIYALGEKE